MWRAACEMMGRQLLDDWRVRSPLMGNLSRLYALAGPSQLEPRGSARCAFATMRHYTHPIHGGCACRSPLQCERTRAAIRHRFQLWRGRILREARNARCLTLLPASTAPEPSE